MKGLFITIEGNDGSGKSTVIASLKKELEKLNVPVCYTREPGGSPIAEKIRELILDKANVGMDDRTEALLYAASRREHITKTIIPALNEGKIILCDRFLDSSLAYQGYARELGVENVLNMNQFATEGLFPDLTILVCVHPEIGMSRIKKDERDMDRLEIEKMTFHTKVYEGYLKVADQYNNRIVAINGEQTKEEVLQAVKDVLYPFIKEHMG
jgi:dTMP kinase